jgi:hypothetical protein
MTSGDLILRYATTENCVRSVGADPVGVVICAFNTETKQIAYAVDARVEPLSLRGSAGQPYVQSEQNLCVVDLDLVLDACVDDYTLAYTVSLATSAVAQTADYGAPRFDVDIVDAAAAFLHTIRDALTARGHLTRLE